jgi:hypothetical protein
MDWKAFWILVAKAALQVLADELDPANRRDRPRPNEHTRGPKEAPTPTPTPAPPPTEAKTAQAAPQSAESAGWGPCTEPQAVTVLRVETDQGSTVSPLSFIGSECYAPERVQRERKAGESRRVRRRTPAEPLPRPEYTPEMRAGIERMRARARGIDVVYPKPAPPPRRRPAGAPLAIACLAPATLMLLAIGEPLTDAAATADRPRLDAGGLSP